MPELESDSEQHLLRSIRRRRMGRGLVVMLPTLVAWWLLSQWIAQRWKLQPDLTRFAILLVFSIPTLFAPRWFGRGLGHDPRETDRLRWLNREQTDRQIARRRIIMAIAIGLTLLMQCVMLLLPGSMDTAFYGSDVLVWLVLISASGLWWRPADLGDEGAQLRYLIAVNHAFPITLVACLAAIVIDAYRGGGILRHALEAALLIGCLTLQLSLIIGEPRTALDNE